MLPPLITGSDDADRTFASLEALWLEQAKNYAAYYASNEAWWDDDGYGGASDEEAMIGDGASEEDVEHSLRFLDALRARKPDLLLRAAVAYRDAIQNFTSGQI